MEKKKGFSQKVEAFFAGRGFYIVLFLCVAVIGVSAWVMLAGTGTNVESEVGGFAPEVNNEYAPASTVMPTMPSATERVSEAPTNSASDTSLEDDSDDEVETMAEADEPPALTEAEVFEEADSSFVWPVSGEIEIPYAVDSLIYNRTMSDWRTHAGIDIYAALGTQVMAASSGVVEKIYTDDLYGVTVVIDHMNGLRSIYSNLAEQPTVSVGDSVLPGEVIGAVGTSALAEAGEVTHLHFSMTLDGAAIDPTDFLP